ncbi:HIT domain-containing protein [Sphingobium fuliginis]|uniref:HIT domain-containing protein n=1 Tax=Sphingobium fuliginis (strain ATCC 27551) TaxID=336203 RepID=A0A7M2GH19_SPHSA|nr:HIT domain-containing protein [Sphingobium fuliginis]QOT72016.1 HIT domain-containing protein [Sphingobium fuliginis]
MHRFQAILSSHSQGRKPWDKIVCESESFVAFPSLGSMVAGWLLIVPRRPLLNLRLLTNVERSELHNFISTVVAKVDAFPGRAYAFEHGNDTIGGPVGCGVDQAHLHIVPLEFDLLKAAREKLDDNMQWTDHDNAANFDATIPDFGEYVSIWSPGDRHGLTGVMREPRSQWVRRVIAEKLGREQAWDYKAHPDIQNLTKTVEVFHTA